MVTSHKARLLCALCVMLGSCKSPTKPTDSDGGQTNRLTVTYVRLDMRGSTCRRPVSLPGFLDCEAVVVVRLNQSTESGFISAFMAYPDSGSFYHGEAQAAAGEVSIRMVNNYIPRCPRFPYTTTLTIRDGRQSPATGPVLLTRSITFDGGCTD